MNELLFLVHTLFALSGVLYAVRLGKGALTLLVALLAVMANLFVLKQVTLFGLTITCPDVYVIGSMMALNLLQEYFGKEAVKRAIFLSFASMLFFGIMSQLHLFYQPAPADWAQGHYKALLGIQPRILGASLAAFLLSQFIDYNFFKLMKEKLHKWPVGIRSGISLFTAQIFDTIAFALLGLSGKMAHLNHIILLAILIKGVIILTTVPFSQFSKRVVS